MPIYSPTGFLDVTNATLRGSKIVTTSNVGIANLNPLNTLSVGSNLQVEDTGSNVLVIHGNVAMAAVTLGAVHVAPVYDLEVVTNLGNTVSNTVQFTNDTTGFVSVSNIEIGTGNLVVDTSTGTVTIGNKLDVTDAHASNLTVASALYANAASGRVGVHTTNPGNFALDIHGSANVGTLTANSLIVTGDLAVTGEITSIRSTTVTVDDPIIGLANNNTTGILDTGFVIQRPGANVAIIFDESEDTLRVGYTQGKHTDTTITMDESIPFHMNVHGDVSVSNLEIGQFSVVAAYGLDHVTNENNSTGDTIISTNATTGLQTTANVNVGRDLQVTGNVTVDTSTFHVDSSTNRVGILTTSPGASLEVSGNVAVSSNLEVGTANLFVDTTTGNVGIGMTDPRHNLDIVSEMNLRSVSNTASIKYNSNVVTEYVRSKKFMKFPRVAMTGATTAGYTASATSVLGDDYTNYAPWKAFDTTIDGNVGWAVGDLYDSSTGEATSSATLFNNRRGEYIDLQLPDAINVLHFIIKTRETGTYIPEDSPGEGYLYGSNDGSNWSELTFFSGLTYGGMTINGNTYEQVQVNATGFYNYLRLQVTKRAGQNSTDQFMAIGELEYYGTPEYDPEAHGTDTIMRSIPNVPNTDWLEVYYDGQDYTSMPATVTDKSGNGLTGTVGSGTTFDSTWNAFKFDGTAQGITVDTTRGANPVTSVGCWVRFTEFNGSDLVMLAGNVGTNGEMIWFGATDTGTSWAISTGGAAALKSIDYDIKLNTWYHLVACWDGSSYPGGMDLYVNGILLPVTSQVSNITTLSLPTTTTVRIGWYLSSAEAVTGDVANFRLFNRTLTTDEIWQLYAYQKEYFQLSPDVVTFKGGRLGIGTSNPQATLDVHGTLKAHSLTLTNNTPPIFKMSLQTTQSNQNDTTTFTKRSLFNLTNGAVLRINNGGAVSLADTDSYLTINYSGYYRITGNILYQAFVDRVAIAVQPAINDVPTGEIFINDYIRNYALNTRSGTSFSTIYYFNKDDSLSFLFAKYGADDGGATMVGDASFIILEKL